MSESRWRDSETDPIYCFTPQTPAMVRAWSLQSQDLGTQSRVSNWVVQAITSCSQGERENPESGLELKLELRHS